MSLDGGVNGLGADRDIPPSISPLLLYFYFCAIGELPSFRVFRFASATHLPDSDFVLRPPLDLSGRGGIHMAATKISECLLVLSESIPQLLLHDADHCVQFCSVQPRCTFPLKTC